MGVIVRVGQVCMLVCVVCVCVCLSACLSVCVFLPSVVISHRSTPKDQLRVSKQKVQEEYKAD